MGATSRRNAGYLFYFVFICCAASWSHPSTAEGSQQVLWIKEQAAKSQAVRPGPRAGYRPGEGFQRLRLLTGYQTLIQNSYDSSIVMVVMVVTFTAFHALVIFFWLLSPRNIGTHTSVFSPVLYCPAEAKFYGCRKH
jgi:hypothetical protein